MSLYLNYFKLRILTFIQYRTAAIAGLMTQFFWGLMMIFIYYAFYTNGSGVNEMNLSQIITYTWLHQSFYALLTVRNNDLEIADSIRSGNVAYEIIRPYNLYFWWYIKLIAKRMANGFLRFSPIIIFSFLMPSNYRLNLPDSFLGFILFIVSLFLGVFLVSAINMLVHTIGFYTYNEMGISGILNSIMELLSGGLVPFVLLPKFIQKSTYFLPFRLISDLPFRIYSGNIGINEGIVSILLQVGWILLFIFIGDIIVKKSLEKVFVQGG